MASLFLGSCGGDEAGSLVSVVQANRRGKAGLQRKDCCVVVGASVCLSVRLLFRPAGPKS